MPYDAYMVRIHGSRLVSKRNRIHLRRILPLAPEQYVIPVNSKEAAEVPEHTKTEVTERYIAVQPPKRFMRLSPEAHRKAPAALPGQDVVTVLKRKEQETKDVWDEISEWSEK